MERAEDPDAYFEPVIFELAKGAKVRVEMGEFWEQLSETARQLGNQPTLYFAIRTYSDEDTYPRRLKMHSEFRAGNDFQQCANQLLWTWLTDLSASRHRFSYEDVEDFIAEFAVRMDEFSTIGDDAADHIHKICGTKVLPYEDSPHSEFIEDENGQLLGVQDDEAFEFGNDATDAAESVLGTDDTYYENEPERGDVIKDGYDDSTDEPDEEHNP